MTADEHLTTPVRIEAAIRHILPPDAKPSTVAVHMDTWVHTLVRAGCDQRQPRSRNAKQVRSELDRVAAAASELAAALNNMSEEAASAFRHPESLGDGLPIISMIAKHADADALVAAHKNAKKQRSEAQELASAPRVKLAIDAAFVFLMATGKRPTLVHSNSQNKKYGLYLDFVSEIFTIRGFEKGAEDAAKKAIRVLRTMENKDRESAS